MDKKEASVEIQVLTKWGYETLLYTNRNYYFHILDDLKECRPNEKFRVLEKHLVLWSWDKEKQA